MRKLEAEVISVDSGDKTLRTTINEAINEWDSDSADINYITGSAARPHP